MKYFSKLGLDPADFQTFTWVCQGLPGVKPRVNQRRLRELFHALRKSGPTSTTLINATVVRSELSELFCEFDSGLYGASERVSPAGARLLVRLYVENELVLKGKMTGEPSAELLAYCNSEQALLDKVQERKAAETAFKARLSDPANFSEDEFSTSILDKLFWRHVGSGGGKLTIGGIEVQKAVTAYRSNSGKSKDFRVSFYWTGSDGTSHERVAPSLYESNRRNDEDRNWGLPE